MVRRHGNARIVDAYKLMLTGHGALRSVLEMGYWGTHQPAVSHCGQDISISWTDFGLGDVNFSGVPFIFWVRGGPPSQIGPPVWQRRHHGVKSTCLFRQGAAGELQLSTELLTDAVERSPTSRKWERWKLTGKSSCLVPKSNYHVRGLPVGRCRRGPVEQGRKQKSCGVGVVERYNWVGRF